MRKSEVRRVCPWLKAAIMMMTIVCIAVFIYALGVFLPAIAAIGSHTVIESIYVLSVSGSVVAITSYTIALGYTAYKNVNTVQVRA